MAKAKTVMVNGAIEWQAAADAAELLLTMAAAQELGLVDRKLPIDVARCTELLLAAAAQGVHPRPGPATNASLLASVRFPETDDTVRALRDWKSLGSGGSILPVRVQRISGAIPDARAIVRYQNETYSDTMAEVRVNARQLQVHLAFNDGWYVIDLEQLVKSINNIANER